MALANTTETKRNRSSRKCVWFVNVLNAPPPRQCVNLLVHGRLGLQRDWIVKGLT